MPKMLGRRLWAVITAVFLALSSFAIINAFTPATQALDNGLAKTPPMGYNSWNEVRCNGLTEAKIRETIDALAERGLAEKGYKYVVIDDCYQGGRDRETHKLFTDQERFPNGIKPLADRAHGKGMKLGIYAVPGSETCANHWDKYPIYGIGSFGYEELDVQTFVDWGVDYLKYDWCRADETNNLTQKEAFTKMRDILAKADRDIVYGISEYGVTQPWTWAQPVANLWRTTQDIGPTWGSVMHIINSQANLYPHSGPGAWNDPDMLQIGNKEFSASHPQYLEHNRSHFAMWSMLAAPLFLGTNVAALPQEIVDIVGNEEVIAIDQDPLGKQARRISNNGGLQVWARPLADGDYAVAFLNASNNEAEMSTTLSAIEAGEGIYQLRDLWQRADVENVTSTISTVVKPHDTKIFRLTAGANPDLPGPTAGIAGNAEVGQGGTAVVPVKIRNYGSNAIPAGDLNISAPAGLTFDPASVSLEEIAPGGEKTVNVSLSASTTATVGMTQVPVTLGTGDWQISGSLTISVTPPMPSGPTDLADLDPTYKEGSWQNKFTRNTSLDGFPMTINGVQYETGWGVNSPATMKFFLGEQCVRLTGKFGVDDDTKGGHPTWGSPSITGEILNGETQLWATNKVYHYQDDPAEFSIDVSGVRELTLKVGDGGDGPAYDHADWVDMQLSCLSPIAEVQGTGDTTPMADQNVVVRGRVTAAYPTGNLNGFYLQTANTGGHWDAERQASDAIFVYTGRDEVPTVGQCVQVEGVAGEYPSAPRPGERSQTQIAGKSDSPLVVTERPTDTCEVAPIALSGDNLPSTEEQKEALEGMLVSLAGDYTVTDNYSLGSYGTIKVTPGSTPLAQGTEVAAPGADALAVETANAASEWVIDDGSSWNYAITKKPNQAAIDTALPYLTQFPHLRTGTPLTFQAPVIMAQNHGWALMPTSHITGETAVAELPIAIENVRPEAAPAVLGDDGDLTVASFNVLNYFTSLGEDEEGCEAYVDRAGNGLTSKWCERARGAYTPESFARQQAKIVAAINGLNADVVALEEIENSPALTRSGGRDTALANLTAALGDGWEYVASPADVPNNDDVIRTAFIYRSAKVSPVGESVILDDPAFTGLARSPLAQEFTPVVDENNEGTNFVVIANHFKSKSPRDEASPENQDQGDGQGAFNAARVAQAKALAAFADTFAPTPTVLIGDFNAYSKEDPITALTAAGFTRLAPEGHSYVYSGRVGSLDHAFVSASASDLVTGAGVWEINAQESAMHEYSRHNVNATNFVDDSIWRSSDHNPLLVGLNVVTAKDPTVDPEPEPGPGPQPNPEPEPGPGPQPNPEPEPGQPAPTDPTDPGTPGAPGKPGDPAAPGAPGKPGDPAAPGTPAQPGQPAKPGKPGGAMPSTGVDMTAAAYATALMLTGAVALTIRRRKS